MESAIKELLLFVLVFFATQGVMFSFLLFFRGGCLELDTVALSKMLSLKPKGEKGDKERKVIDVEAKVIDRNKTKEYIIVDSYDSKGQRK